MRTPPRIERPQTHGNQQFQILKFLKTPLGEGVFLLLVFIFAVLVRRIGLKFGYPFLTHPDEWAIVEPAYLMTTNQTLDSGYFMRPNQITQLLNFFYLNALSLIKTGANLATTFPLNEFSYYFASRWLIVILGALIPMVAYKIGKESKVDFSIPAALLFAFFPSFVQHSHYVTPDIPITLFTLLVIFFSVRYVRLSNIKYLYLATLFAAINTAEKYPGLLSFGIIIFAIVWIQKEKYKTKPLLMLKRIVVESLKFFGLYLILLYMIAPNLFINYGNVIQHLKTESRSIHLGADGLSWGGNLLYYIQVFCSNTNLIVVICAIVGIISIFVSKDYPMLFVFYGLFYWIILSKLALHWERWALPMYTFPLLCAAVGISYLQQIFQKQKILQAAIWGIWAFSMLSLIMHSLSTSIRLSYVNTTFPAYQYCQEMNIGEENSIYDGYSPFLPGSSASLDLSLLNDSTEYIILSSNMYNRYYAEPDRYIENTNSYDRVRENHTLIKEFSATAPLAKSKILAWADDILYYARLHSGIKQPLRYNGPTIQIFKVNR
ncbi:MAG TPA: glycosyltransferase family 39 protein [Anaerolineaceae bacterium]|jgi:hypothetical protein|nr:glycosyltransferase family 39 protein [Anaerolineaceae bacterium]